MYPFTKIKLRSPGRAPAYLFTGIDDPTVDRCIAAGWTIDRTWTVTGPRESVTIWPAA